MKRRYGDNVFSSKENYERIGIIQHTVNLFNKERYDNLCKTIWVESTMNSVKIFVHLINESKPKTHVKGHTFSTNLNLDRLTFSRCIMRQGLYDKKSREMSALTITNEMEQTGPRISMAGGIGIPEVCRRKKNVGIQMIYLPTLTKKSCPFWLAWERENDRWVQGQTST